LPVLKTVSPPSNVLGRQLFNLSAEFDALGTERVERAVAIEVAHRTERYLAGLDAYRHSVAAAIAPLHHSVARRHDTAARLGPTARHRRYWSCPRRLTDTTSSISCSSAAFCSLLRVVISGRSSSIDRTRQPGAPFRFFRLHSRAPRTRFSGGATDRGRSDRR
jgi:hypothetical protein